MGKVGTFDTFSVLEYRPFSVVHRFPSYGANNSFKPTALRGLTRVRVPPQRSGLIQALGCMCSIAEFCQFLFRLRSQLVRRFPGASLLRHHKLLARHLDGKSVG